MIIGGGIRTGGIRSGGAVGFNTFGGALRHDGLSANFLNGTFYTRPAGGALTGFANAQTMFLWSSSTKWTRNAAGVLVASGANTPALEWGASSNLLGVRVEGARANLVLQSQTTNTTWVPQNATPTVNVATAPDGTNTANRFTGIVISTVQGVQQGTISTSSGATITVSEWFKYENNRWVLFGLYDSAWRGVSFDIQNGVIGTAAAGTTSRIEAFPNGWYRCSVTYTITGTTFFIGHFLQPDGTASTPTLWSALGQTALNWGAQGEAGSFASSYIPTTTASVTRNADNISRVLGSEFSATDGTMLAYFSVPSIASSSADRVIASIDDGTANEQFRYRIQATQSDADFLVTDGGIAQADIDGPDISAGVLVKAAMAWSANDFELVVNGASQGTDLSGTLPTVTTLMLGSGPSGANGLFGNIGRLEMWPRRLTQAEMIGLTA